jgi:multiple sugar transport system permease protein
MKGQENLKAFLFIVPSLAGVAVFFVVPFIMSLGYATTDAGGFVWFDNFIKLFNNESFQLAAGNTVKFMLCAIPLNIAVPLGIALLLSNMGGGAWIKTVFMSPLVIPTACAAFFFRSLFTSNGLLSGLLGVKTDWLLTDSSFTIAVALYVWKNMGFNLVLALAGLADIPKDYYEWASVEGMGKRDMFLRITLVYLVPSMFIMFVMSFISSFKIYRELFMLSGNYPNEKIYMLQHYMNNQFTKLNYQNLTTAAFITTAVISAFMVMFFIVDKKSEYGE